MPAPTVRSYNKKPAGGWAPLRAFVLIPIVKALLLAFFRLHLFLLLHQGLPAGLQLCFMEAGIVQFITHFPQADMVPQHLGVIHRGLQVHNFQRQGFQFIFHGFDVLAQLRLFAPLLFAPHGLFCLFLFFVHRRGSVSVHHSLVIGIQGGRAIL